jgi:hypothetical protein
MEFLSILIVLIFPLSDFIVRLFLRKNKNIFVKKVNKNYTIIVPIYGSIKYLDNLSEIRKYGDKLLFVTTDKESEMFYRDLYEISKEIKSKVLQFNIGNLPTTPWILNTKATKHVKSKYVIWLDADTYPSKNFDYLIGEMSYYGYDITSLNIFVNNPKNIIEKIQDIEYKIVSKLKHYFKWMTSGACISSKTSIMNEIVSNHTNYFSGGDMEIGIRAKLYGYKLGYINFIIYSTAPSNIISLFHQRILWTEGDFRLWIINILLSPRNFPYMIFYHSFLVFSLLYLKIYVVNFLSILIVYFIYLIYSFFMHKELRNLIVFIYPIYYLLQLFIVFPIGVFYYFYYSISNKNFGIIKI